MQKEKRKKMCMISKNKKKTQTSCEIGCLICVCGHGKKWRCYGARVTHSEGRGFTGELPPSDQAKKSSCENVCKET